MPELRALTGTRIMVSIILDNIAAGISRPEILASYPTLTFKELPPQAFRFNRLRG